MTTNGVRRIVPAIRRILELICQDSKCVENEASVPKCIEDDDDDDATMSVNRPPKRRFLSVPDYFVCAITLFLRDKKSDI
jgi:hypothetical protein